MKLIDIADQIFRDLDQPESTTLPSIVAWLQYSSVSKLNVLIGSCVSLKDGDVDPELTDVQASIIYQLYMVHYYDKQIQKNLGASAFDWSEVVEGDSRVRRVSKNEIAKTYQQLSKSSKDILDDLIFYYKQNLILPASFSSPGLVRFCRLQDN